MAITASSVPKPDQRLLPLKTWIRPELIQVNLPGEDPQSVLAAFARLLFEELDGEVARDEILRLLLEREGLCSTGLGSGVAIPHCKISGLKAPILAVATTAKPIDFGALDGEPVRVFLTLLSPASDPVLHLRVLSSISRWLKDEKHLTALRASSTVDEIRQLLDVAGPES